MRKLKLQMQISLDGYVAGTEGQLDWMTWNWDEKLKNFVTNLTNSVDSILLGRNMAEGFINHWQEALNKQNDPENLEFAKKMVGYEKFVFSKTLQTIQGQHTKLIKEDLEQEVDSLKSKTGKDMIVYGGASFVSSLIEKKLIDELYLFVNPTAISKGLRIFSDKTSLSLQQSVAFECGIVVNQYKPL